MTIPQLITFVRNQTNKKSTTQITDAEILIYLNIGYHGVENKIVSEINEDYFFEYFTTSLVANQNEYTLQPSSSTQVGAKKILSVEVKWTTADTYYSLLTMRKNTEQKTSLDRLSVLTPAALGFYDLKDSSIFLYPTPAESVTNGLKMQAIVDLIDLVDAGAETTLFPGHTELRQFHQIVALGAIPYVYRHFEDHDKEQLAWAEYERESAKMISQLNDRQPTPTEMTLPDGSYFKY